MKSEILAVVNIKTANFWGFDTMYCGREITKFQEERAPSTYL
jgi:hypothetical protein